jgi:hypothetical protein
MLRKTTQIILTLFLMVATTGITCSMHYCGGELVYISINNDTKSCCDSSGGCCENKTLQFVVEDDYVIPVQIENSRIVELNLLFSVLFVSNFNLFPEGDEAFKAYDDHSPPPTTQTRLSLLQTYLC